MPVEAQPASSVLRLEIKEGKNIEAAYKNAGEKDQESHVQRLQFPGVFEAEAVLKADENATHVKD